MRHIVTSAALIIGVASSLPIRPAAIAWAQIPVSVESAARALVPLLKGVRQRLQPHWRVQSGTLPPSPFSGRSATIVAIQIGRHQVDVDPNVVESLNRLLAWKISASVESPELTLFNEWLDQLKVKAVSMLTAPGHALECETPCVIQRFTRPDAPFGKSRREREEFRDYLLLQALIAANDKQP